MSAEKMDTLRPLDSPLFLSLSLLRVTKVAYHFLKVKGMTFRQPWYVPDFYVDAASFLPDKFQLADVRPDLEGLFSFRETDAKWSAPITPKDFLSWLCALSRTLCLLKNMRQWPDLFYYVVDLRLLERAWRGRVLRDPENIIPQIYCCVKL